MKNLKYGITVLFLSAGMVMFAQQKVGFGKNAPTVKTEKTQDKVGFGKEVPAKKTGIKMPEKDDKQAKKWRKKGLKDSKIKNSKVKKGKGNAFGTHKFGKEGREFGQYRAWQARNKAKKDNDFVILHNNVINRINKPAESRKIIKNKQSEIFLDYTMGKITKAEYNQLHKELEQAEKDIAYIESVSKVRR